MQIHEIYADEAGETHFRRKTIDVELRDFAPPSAPVSVSVETPMTTGVFLIAPPGWDRAFHPSPRPQYAVMLEGRATVTVSDGDVLEARPGDVFFLNDQDSKGHLTQVQGDDHAAFLLIGLPD